MSSTELSNFLRVALEIQSTPFSGIHVDDGVAAATDGVMLVAKTFSGEFLRGEGAISPKAAKVLAALAEASHIGSIEVNGNRVTATAQTTRYDEKTGGEVAGEYCDVKLPEFYCPRAPVARMFATLTDEGRGWQQIVENPRLKTVKEASAKDYVALVDDPRNGGELFRPKADNDTHWYSVAQLRRGLRLFGKNSRLSVRRNAKGWLAFGDQWGYTFAVTPFVKHNETQR
jgi:hypothetical protein